MPPYTTIKTFMDALMTGRTNTTKALDALLQRNLQADQEDWARLQQPHSLDKPGSAKIPEGIEPGWWKDYLREKVLPTLSKGELDHIDAWPEEQKEQVRATIVAAKSDSRTVHFFWELHGGKKEDTQIDVPAHGDITITFRNPRDRLEVSGLTWGDIKVKM